MQKHYNWNDIEAALHDIANAGGGFSIARRGIVTLADDTRVFIKIGVDDNTRRWAKKEIAVYRFLERQGYPYAPRLLAVNPDETGFALETLDAAAGWDWSEQWTEERLDKTLVAMDALASITPTGADKTLLGQTAIDQSDNGWRPLAESEEKQQTLLAKLRSAGYNVIADSLYFAAMAEKSGHYVFKDDALVHNDIRADNAAWNPNIKKVMLVDWNWTQLGDRRTDLAATLTHVQKSGFNIIPNYTSRLDADALHWMAGFWFHSAIKPIWPGGPARLRDHQLKAAVTAWELSGQVGVTIEKAQARDAEAINKLLRQTWLATYPNKDAGITENDIRLRTDGEHGERVQKNITKWRKNISAMDGKSAAFVARKAGEIVGLTYGTIEPEGRHRIGALYVLPEAQTRGVGRRLMQTNLVWHGESEPIYLAVAAYNQKAINFYEQFGFVKTGKKVEDLPARKRGLKEIPEIEMMRPAKQAAH